MNLPIWGSNWPTGHSACSSMLYHRTERNSRGSACNDAARRQSSTNHSDTSTWLCSTVEVAVRKNGAPAPARWWKPASIPSSSRLPLDGPPRVLPRVDVAARRQPQPRLHVVAEQHAAGGRVHRDEVHHQVPARRGGGGGAEQRRARLDPGRDVGLIGRLLLVSGAHLGCEAGDHHADVVVCHRCIMPIGPRVATGRSGERMTRADRGAAPFRRSPAVGPRAFDRRPAVGMAAVHPAGSRRSAGRRAVGTSSGASGRSSSSR